MYREKKQNIIIKEESGERTLQKTVLIIVVEAGP